MRRRVSARLSPAVLTTLAAVLLALPLLGNTDFTDVTGTYVLSTINGKPLPFVIQASGSDSSIILKGSAVFTSNTYILSSTLRVVISGNPTEGTSADSGTYTQSGSTLTLMSNDDETTISGTVSGNAITLSNLESGSDSTYTAVFKKK